MLLGTPSSTCHQLWVPVPHVTPALTPPKAAPTSRGPTGARVRPSQARNPKGGWLDGGWHLASRGQWGQSSDGATSQGTGKEPSTGASSTLYWAEWEATGVARGPPAGERGQCHPRLALKAPLKVWGGHSRGSIELSPPSSLPPYGGAEPRGLVATGGGTGAGGGVSPAPSIT